MKHLNRSAIFASSLGNMIEWYDFGLLSAFSSLFATLFFPAHDPKTATLEIFGVFATGFIARPLGGFLFGHFGDKIGRALTLRLSILFIGIPTLLMVFLPTYQQIGIYAPILLICIRILQGISLGGEFTGVVIYLGEMAPNNHRAFITSFAGTAANCGILGGSLVAFLTHHYLSTQHFQTYGWRLAYLFGAIITWIIFFLRRNFVETDVFKKIYERHKIVNAPVSTVIKTIPGTMLKVACLALFGMVVYYMCFIYLQTYLVDFVHLNLEQAMTVQISCIVAMLVLVPLGGVLGDKWGRKNTFIVMTAAMLVLAIPCFYLLSSRILLNIILAMSAFTVLSSLDQGTGPATIVEQFPTPLRYSGLAVSYNITQAIFGGTAPFVAAFLMLHFSSTVAPAYYLLVVSLLTLLTVIFSLKETSNRPLWGQT